MPPIPPIVPAVAKVIPPPIRRHHKPITFLLVVTVIVGLVGWATSGFGTVFQTAPPAGSCALANPAFCETFDAPAGTGNRSGQLNGTLWGVSHIGDQNQGGPANGWAQAQLALCNGSQVITPPNDIQVCNGHLVEGMYDNGGVTPITIYPKQPFDFAGRTGRVTFDVSNDSQGSHAAWPEFWITDQPVPSPFAHEDSLWSLPRNGFGIRFAGFSNNGCPQGGDYVGVDSAITVSNYVENDTFNGGNLQITGLDCVKKPTAAGQLNHYEIDVSTSKLEVYGTDAGTTAPLKHLATIPVALTFTRGVIWLEDVHYNGDKFNSQGTHAFTWDNVGFDGPVLPRDLTYDVNDNMTVAHQANNGLQELNLGWSLAPGQGKTFTVNNVASPSTASGALLMFGFWSEAPPPFSFDYAINGHVHSFAWPYPDTKSFTPKTLAIPLVMTDLQAGTNTLTLSPAVVMNVFNIDLALLGAGGGGVSGTPVPTATVVNVPATATSVSATSTALPTTPPTTQATVTPAAQTCTVIATMNGVDTRYTRPLSECANQ